MARKSKRARVSKSKSVKRPRKVVSAKTKQAVVAAVARGETHTKVAKRFKVHPMSVGRWVAASKGGKRKMNGAAKHVDRGFPKSEAALISELRTLVAAFYADRSNRVTDTLESLVN